LLTQPLEPYLVGAKNVLIAGAGGGFDFVCGVPLAASLQNRGCSVHFSNLSFSALNTVKSAQQHSEMLWEVNADAYGPDYFPEGWLAKWYRQQGREVPVWCFAASGLQPYTESFAYLVQLLHIDSIVVVDGGVDSLLRGDEHSLGTPLWDALTVGAANAAPATRKVLCTTAFGAERWDRISHAQALARIADLTRADALLGATTLLRSTAEGNALIDAAEFIFRGQQGSRGSIVISSLLAALRGEFGERPVNAATQSTPIWVSPLMALYWFFGLAEVARQKRFLPALQGTQTLGDAAEQLEKWRQQHPVAPWENIPI
jgi:hypothetical protein